MPLYFIYKDANMYGKLLLLLWGCLGIMRRLVFENVEVEGPVSFIALLFLEGK